MVAAPRRSGSVPSPADPTSYREVETKYDIPPDYRVPQLDRFTKPGGRIDVDTVSLMSTYYDTAAMDLAGSHITVRRRSGTVDTGWQMKLPGDGFRTELHWPSRGYAVPKGIAALLEPFLGAIRVAPAIRLEVRRVRHRLFDAAGQLIAEIALDDVRAIALGVAVRDPRWHELEAELGPAGDPRILSQLGKALTKAGAVPSTSHSKLSRAAHGHGSGRVEASAGSVLADYISAQGDAIVSGHFAIYYDNEDSVHQTRVACRRLRSTLSTFERFFDSSAAAFADELQWYAGVLGRVRDVEVLRRRLAAAIAALPKAMVVGPIARRIDEQLAARLATARTELLTAQASARYHDLLVTLRCWVTAPPFTVRAERRAAALQQSVEKIERKLADRLAVATAPDGSDTDMHSARKAGKKARYAAEATHGEQSSDVKRAKQLQDLLGEFQDSVVAVELLEQLAAMAREEGEDTFSYGVLIGEQHALGQATRARVADFSASH
jgi:CHAD domain-containing protein